MALEDSGSKNTVLQGLMVLATIAGYMWNHYFYTVQLEEQQLRLALWKKRWRRYVLLEQRSSAQAGEPPSQALAALLAQIELRDCPVALALSDDACVVKQLQFSASLNIYDILQKLAEQSQHYFGNSAAELNIDAEILTKDKISSSFVNVRAAALRKQSLQPILEVFHAYHLMPAMVSPVSLALEQAARKFLTRSKISVNDLSVVIYLDENSFMIHAFSHHFIYSRQVHVHDLTAIVQELERQWSLCLSALSITVFDHILLAGNQQQLQQLIAEATAVFLTPPLLLSPPNELTETAVLWGLASSYGEWHGA